MKLASGKPKGIFFFPMQARRLGCRVMDMSKPKGRLPAHQFGFLLSAN